MISNMVAVNDYISGVIEQGDRGSKLLRALTVETLKNNSLIEIVGNMVGVRVPEKYHLVVFSDNGDPLEKDPQNAAEIIRTHGLKAQVAGIIYRGGLELTAFDSSTLHFRGV
jgi:hypothetical protein